MISFSKTRQACDREPDGCAVWVSGSQKPTALVLNQFPSSVFCNFVDFAVSKKTQQLHDPRGRTLWEEPIDPELALASHWVVMSFLKALFEWVLVVVWAFFVLLLGGWGGYNST